MYKYTLHGQFITLLLEQPVKRLKTYMKSPFKIGDFIQLYERNEKNPKLKKYRASIQITGLEFSEDIDTHFPIVYTKYKLVP